MGKTKNQKQSPAAGRAAPYQPPPPAANTFRGAKSPTSIMPPPPPPPPLRIAPLGNRRGRPSLRMEPVGPRATSTNGLQDMTRLINRLVKKNGRLVPTENNGFARGLKPDCIVYSFISEDGPMFFLRFKSRKIPELITLNEARRKASALLVDYYCSIMVNAMSLDD